MLVKFSPHPVSQHHCLCSFTSCGVFSIDDKNHISEPALIQVQKFPESKSNSAQGVSVLLPIPHLQDKQSRREAESLTRKCIFPPLFEQDKNSGDYFFSYEVLDLNQMSTEWY